jgi:hypothetical protein
MEGSLSTIATSSLSAVPPVDTITAGFLTKVVGGAGQTNTSDIYNKSYKREIGSGHSNTKPVPFGEVLKQHKEIQDNLRDSGFKYNGVAIVPDGDKKTKDKKKHDL